MGSSALTNAGPISYIWAYKPRTYFKDLTFARLTVSGMPISSRGQLKRKAFQCKDSCRAEPLKCGCLVTTLHVVAFE